MDISLEQIIVKLHEENIKAHIAKPYVKYRGVRFSKQEGYLQISQNGHNCYVTSENKDYICFFNGRVNEVFETLLDVFDLYQQWEKALSLAAKNMDFSGIVRCCWDFFCNPILIHDTNYKILALSTELSDELFQSTYSGMVSGGAISPLALSRFEKYYRRQDTDPSSRPLRLQYDENNPKSCITCGVLKQDSSLFGKILILEYNRPLCTADSQNIQIVCRLISEQLAFPSESPLARTLDNILVRFVRDIHVSDADIAYYYHQSGWNPDDELRVVVIEPENISRTQRMLLHAYAADLFVGLPCFLLEEQIVLFCNERILSLDSVLDKLRKSYIMKSITAIGVSLSFRGIEQIHQFEKQCQYAIRKHSNDTISFFFYDAVDYIISSNSLTEKLCACMPQMRIIYSEKHTKHNEVYKTLKSYLMNGGSIIQASGELGIHKNTISYRISRFSQNFPLDMNQPYVREYMLTSIRVLENANGLIASANHLNPPVREGDQI